MWLNNKVAYIKFVKIKKPQAAVVYCIFTLMPQNPHMLCYKFVPPTGENILY